MTPGKEFVFASSGIVQLDLSLFEVAFEFKNKSEGGIQMWLDQGFGYIVNWNYW